MLARHARGVSWWTRWRTLSAFERRMTITAAVVIPLMHVSLRGWATRTLAWIRRRPLGPPVPGSAVAAQQTAWAVIRASNRGLYRGNCLSKSATLLWLLRRQGIEGDLQFGARMDGGAFSAHAWVELDGVVLNDSASVDRRFTRLRGSRPSDSHVFPAAPSSTTTPSRPN